MGKEFEQYLPQVMPAVLKAADHKPDVAVMESKESLLCRLGALAAKLGLPFESREDVERLLNFKELTKPFVTGLTVPFFVSFVELA